MSMKAYPVVPFKSGLERDAADWIIPDDAFPELTDAYLYKGRVTRRMGNLFLGRGVQSITTGNAGGPAPLPFNLIPVALGLPAVISPYINTLVIPLGLGIAPGTVVLNIAGVVYTDNGHGHLLSGPLDGTIDYITGDINVPFVGGGAVTVLFCYYTGRPIMALPSRDTIDINADELILFDTVKANRWNDVLKTFEDISFSTAAGAPITWTGTDADFFWTCNYYIDAANNKLLWATNNTAADGIRYYNGNPLGGWTNFVPQLNNAATTFLLTCLMIIPYQGFLVALNTVEGPQGGAGNRYPQRARWSIQGNPTNAATSWVDDQSTIPGAIAGYKDAATGEAIVSCGFYRNTLIVYFERSTWALIYTGNNNQPFGWQRINTQFGSESTFSTVNFDKGLFSVGDTAITLANNSDVSRIDQKIPEEVFNFHNPNSGPIRIHGIRDYYYQFVYWNFPNLDGGKFPNTVLVLNYLEASYSFYTDSYTCFGYLQIGTDIPWSQVGTIWKDANWIWGAGTQQAEFPSIVAGNQQGFVMWLDQTSGNNGKSLYISAITNAANATITSPNHNLNVNDYITISDVRGMIGINGTYQVLTTPTPNTFTVSYNSTAAPLYTVGGLITFINNINIITKKYNPFIMDGKSVRLQFLDLFIDNSDVPGGYFNMDVLVSDNSTLPVQTLVVPTEQQYAKLIPNDKIWQRVYASAQGQFIQLHIYFDDAFMKDFTLSGTDVRIHAINLWLSPSGNIVSEF